MRLSFQNEELSIKRIRFLHAGICLEIGVVGGGQKSKRVGSGKYYRVVIEKGSVFGIGIEGTGRTELRLERVI